MSTLKLNLKRIDPIKYALIVALIMAIISFISILFVFLLGSVVGGGEAFGALGTVFSGGILMVFIGPIIYFVIGFIFTWIGAVVLNFVLSKMGGLDIEFNNSNIDISEIGRS